jgi:response regulator RpfG family c-di-GMP phosphodiesterase
VAGYSVALAQIVDAVGHGPYRHVSFTREQIRELRYASLLHDFGKVGVREQILVKAKKLYPADLAHIRQRYALIKRTAERDFWRRRAELLERGEPVNGASRDRLEAAHAAELAELERFLELVVRTNEPTILADGNFDALREFARRSYRDLDGVEQPYLTDEELRFLTIRKGSLDEHERLQIESHVTHTWRFLQQIPWTRELHQVPLIAYGHHEKLDGRGYPRRITGNAIPIQTRMMTISDIYDALTAQDRPYKPAVSHDRALDILRDEVEDGQLDTELFRLFVEARVFERPPG